MKASKMDQRRYYRGVPMIGYDLIKELVLATVVIGLIVLGLAFALSSPDIPSVTIKSWAAADPVDFVTTASAELAGTSDTAVYGPPYTDGSDAVQAIGPIVPQKWAGNAMHIDTAQQFVLGSAHVDGRHGRDSDERDLESYGAATSDQQQTWITNYTDALANATVAEWHGEGRCRRLRSGHAR